MKDEDKTREQLIAELAELKARLERLSSAYRDGPGFDGLTRNPDQTAQLIHLAPFGVFLIDLGGTIVAANRSGAERFGQNIEDLIGTRLSDHAPPDVAEKRSRMGIEALKTRSEVRFEDHIQGRWYDNRVVPIIDPDGRITHLGVYGMDVTERRNNEEALRKNESLLKEAQRLARIGSFERNLGTRETTVSEELYRIYGYEPGEVEPPETMIERHVHSEDREIERKARLDAASKTDRPIEADYRIIRTDGQVRTMHRIVHIERDEAGNPVRAFGTTQDVTERKRIETALKNSELRFREFAELMPETVFEMDETGRLTFVNWNAFEQFGYSVEEFEQGLEALSMVHPEDRERVALNIARSMQGEKTGLNEYVALRRDGTSFPVMIHSSPITREGRFAGLRGFIVDITERKQVEQALNRAKQELEDLYDNSPDLYVSIEPKDGRIIKCNLTAATALGYAKEEIIGRRVFEIYHPDCLETARKTIADFLKTGEVRNVELILRRKDGVRLDVVLNATAVRDEAGNILFSRSAWRDVTQLRQAKEEKARLEQQLRQAQKMEAVGTLAGGVAHDFNNILMGIAGYVSLMEMATDREHPHYDYLKRIQKQVQSATDLTRQLLGFARGGKYEVKPVDPNRLVQGTADMFGRTRKEIRIHFRFQEDVWPVKADRGQIEQTLLNLCLNAWQAMPSGGDLFLSTENVYLDERYTRPYEVEPGRYVKISVTDTGVGMDENTRQRVFDPFFTTRSMGRGTGLGLASAYGIVRNHGGIINVYSEKGQGTTFNIYLPVSDESVGQEAEFPQDIMGGSETILLVDDEPMVLDVGRKMLEWLGYRVLAARSGREALEMYQSRGQEIDLVILDMIMPGFGGGQTFDQLKKIDPDVRVILSSGYSLNGQAMDIMKRGCRGFIQKPYNLDGLSVRVREALGRD
ncbi:MAG: PAS domain S-box protein [Proteobacteria bacterium]|nr:PAS domain S-box protein [Pseudomonadota bacterium]